MTSLLESKFASRKVKFSPECSFTWKHRQRWDISKHNAFINISNILEIFYTDDKYAQFLDNTVHY